MSRTSDLVEAEGGLVAPFGKTAVPITDAEKTLLKTELGFVLVDATANAVAITLPAADAPLDVLVRRVDGSGNRVKVQASGADKIKFHTHLNAAGYPFFVLMGAGDFWHLRSDGVGGWWPIARLNTEALGRVVFDSSTQMQPGGFGAQDGSTQLRADWPWLWDHAQASGMLTTEAARVGMEGGWTSGDGATTFRRPESRGEFPRFLDDGRGVDKSLFYGVLTSGSNVITSAQLGGVSIGPGVPITGAGIPVGTTVQSVNIAGQTVTMSANATASSASVVVTVSGRAPGSSQVGTGHSIDSGSSSALIADKVSGVPDPGVARTGIGLDAGEVSKYNPNAGYYAAGTASSGGLTESADVSWGVARPRNIAYPGRIKMI